MSRLPSSQFDVVLANPPFNLSGWGQGIPVIRAGVMASRPRTTSLWRYTIRAADVVVVRFDEKITVHEQIAATTAALLDAIAPMLFTGNPG